MYRRALRELWPGEVLLVDVHNRAEARRVRVSALAVTESRPRRRLDVKIHKRDKITVEVRRL
jgi:hypothetical protein